MYIIYFLQQKKRVRLENATATSEGWRKIQSREQEPKNKRVPITVKYFKCRICPNTFITPRDRKKHMLFEHESLNDNNCDDCDFTFNRKNAFDKHKKNCVGKIHQATPKSFKCKFCPIKFSEKTHREQHTLREHPKTQQPNIINITPPHPIPVETNIQPSNLIETNTSPSSKIQTSDDCDFTFDRKNVFDKKKKIMSKKYIKRHQNRLIVNSVP